MTGSVGKIENRERSLQCKDYTGMRWGNITPSDADGIFDYKDRAFFMLEYKYGNAQMPAGQRICLERFCDSITKVKGYSVAILAHHNQQPHEDIDCANAIVSTYRIGYEWKKTSAEGTTVYKLVNSVIRESDHQTQTMTETEYWLAERAGMLMENGHTKTEADRLAWVAWRAKIHDEMEWKKRTQQNNEIH